MAKGFGLSQRKFNVGTGNSRRKRKSDHNFLLRILICVSIPFMCIFLMTGYIFSHTDSNSRSDMNNITPHRQDQNSLGAKHEIYGHIDNINNNDPLHVSLSSSGERESSQLLPKWIQDYTSWHQEMRSKFPGKAIIEDPNAPPVLVRTCLGLCGGLHDRLGQLPLDLYLANQTQRVLLIKWIKPQPLEEFLVPPKNGLDWVFPKGIEGWGTNCRTLNLCAKQVRAQPAIETNIGGNREIDLDELIADSISNLNGKMKDVKAVTFYILGHLTEEVLEARLKVLGETDMIHGTPSFGHIFRKFFKPHPNVQKEIDEVYAQYGMVPNEYSIAHCRVRHPKAYAPGEKFNGEFISNADKLGLPFEGRFQQLALDIATRAIKCAVTLPDVANHPIYFMGDESNLVTHMTRDLLNKTFVNEHAEWFSNEYGSNATAKDVVSKYQIVARNQNIKNAHIDKNKGRPPEAYYATFVDLYLGINARCVSFGIGCYAMFAAKLSGTKCKIRYAVERWGVPDTVHHEETQSCSLPP